MTQRSLGCFLFNNPEVTPRVTSRGGHWGSSRRTSIHVTEQLLGTYLRGPLPHLTYPWIQPKKVLVFKRFAPFIMKDLSVTGTFYCVCWGVGGGHVTMETFQVFVIVVLMSLLMDIVQVGRTCPSVCAHRDSRLSSQ